MPLVDYGSSDESEIEGNSDDKKNDLLLNNVEKKTTSNNKAVSVEENLREDVTVNRDIGDNSFIGSDIGISKTSDPTSSLFDNLPLPKSVSFREDSLKLLHKKINQPVKILLPSLKDLESRDNEETIKKKPSTKGSGLFALLPAPKNITNLVPKVIQNKVTSINKIKPITKKSSLPILRPTKVVDEGDNDDQETPASFFFTSSDDNFQPEVAEEEPMKIDQLKSDTLYNSVNLNSLSTDKVLNSAVGGEVDSSSCSENNISLADSYQIQGSADMANIDDEAIEKLCGTRARKRKGELHEEVIDINVDSMVGDAYMWLSKDLTKEQEHRGFKKARNLSSVERRKHQITYLASQAKEKEMELRNQWANSRMTRKQTQSKYGF